MIPFNATFRGVSLDKNLPEKLKTNREKSVILAWLVAGAIRYYKSGLVKDAFSEKATFSYLEENNCISRFFEQCIKMEVGKKCKASELYAKYAEFCKEHGNEYLSEAAFGKKLTSRGLQKKRLASGNFYIGMTLVV